jgi:hypothetical protein
MARSRPAERIARWLQLVGVHAEGYSRRVEKDRASRRLRTELANRVFVIEQDGRVGWYLYVYAGERCTHDYVQDTLALAKSHAATQFGVPEDAWGEMDRAATPPSCPTRPPTPPSRARAP